MCRGSGRAPSSPTIVQRAFLFVLQFVNQIKTVLTIALGLVLFPKALSLG